MNAIQLLTMQHDEVDALIAKLEKSKDSKVKRETFATLADNLAAHVAIEEKLFYPAVVAKKTEEMLHEAVEEHLAVKRLLADMLALSVTDDQFEAKLSVMKEGLEHHNHKEEEGELFPEVRTLLSSEELIALGSEMLAMFEQLMTSDPRKQIPEETTRAARVPAPAQ